mgnify:CR=1 FL=1
MAGLPACIGENTAQNFASRRSRRSALGCASSLGTFSATRMQVFTMVEYPTTLPSLFSGLRIASTLAVIGVVVGELVGGNMGLGYMLVFFEGQGNTAAVFVVIAALTVIGIIAYYAVVLAERRVLHYLPSAQRSQG